MIYFLTNWKAVASSMGTQAMCIPTLTGSRWYAPYWKTGQLGAFAMARLTYEDEILLEVEERHLDLILGVVVCWDVGTVAMVRW